MITNLFRTTTTMLIMIAFMAFMRDAKGERAKAKAGSQAEIAGHKYKVVIKKALSVVVILFLVLSLIFQLK